MIIVEPLGGLANRMRVIASGLWLKKTINGELTCFWNETDALNSPFNVLFENIDGLVIQSKLEKYNDIRATNQASLHKKIVSKIINKYLGVDYCIVERDFGDLIWNKKIDILEIAESHKNIYFKTCEEFGDNFSEFKKFTPVLSLQEKIDSIEKQFTKSTIGLHIRRTDNVESIKFSPLELFLEKINFEVSENENVNFFLSTDDLNVEERIISEFGNKIITHKKEFSRQTVAGMQDAVVDMFCLSKTAVIYGSYWSSFSEISARIGEINLIKLIKP